jgi:hypothetical protein
VVQRRLSVGHRSGDAVNQHTHSAHAELCAGAEATNGDAFPESVVVPVVHLDAGNRVQWLAESESRASAKRDVRPIPRDCVCGITYLGRQPEGADNDLSELPDG